MQSTNDKGDYPAYAGVTGMYEVHKFMGLNQYEVGYFIQQVALSAASFGAADSDVIAVASALMDLFGYQCLPPRAIVVPMKEAQSICTAQNDCMSNEHSNCSNPAYANAVLIDIILRAIHPDAMA